MATSTSLSSAKLVSSFISTAINRRGFSAAAAQGAVSRSGAAAAMGKSKRTGEEMGKKSETVSWVPDPVTGCYKPENQVAAGGDVDAVELRAVLLNHKN